MRSPPTRASSARPAPIFVIAAFGSTPLQAPAPADAPLAAALPRRGYESFEIFNAERRAQGGAPLVMSLGLATGEVVAGYTGLPRRAVTLRRGAAVDLARRLERHAGSGRIDRDRQPDAASAVGRIATEPLAALPRRQRHRREEGSLVEAHAIGRDVRAAE
ncbi:MAG: hypothetical protein U1F25_08500 [Rubrivivax sp.]